MNAGHFFCSRCDDVVFIRYNGSALEVCPACHEFTAQWVPHIASRRGGRLIDPQLARELFAKMKEACHAS